MTLGPAGTSHTLAGTWLEHDRAPQLAVVLPVLSTAPLPATAPWQHPPLLRQWWEESGHLSAQIIDARGQRTDCELWQLGRHIEDHECPESINHARQIALQTERLKAQCLLYFTSRQRRKLLKAVGREMEARGKQGPQTNRP